MRISAKAKSLPIRTPYFNLELLGNKRVLIKVSKLSSIFSPDFLTGGGGTKKTKLFLILGDLAIQLNSD